MDSTQSVLSLSTEQNIDFPLIIHWAHPAVRFTVLGGGAIQLGRAGEGDCYLPGSVVSRHHATIVPRDRAWWLEDQRSKNGTFLNGQRITSAPLHEQDVVRIGEWVGVVARVSAARVEARSPVSSVSDAVFGGTTTDKVWEQVKRIAATPLRVMFVGETGTGKDVFAREVHRLSGVSGEWVALNCAALPEHTAEGELFGYRRGAFTGADRAHAGHFRNAHQGTLFLDEISDLGPTIQVKLLRALEERRVVPLGQSHSEPADARVICAAYRPLHELVEEGSFRPDLYSRLNGLQIRIAPLRERREEVLGLFHRFLSSEGHQAPALSPEAAEQLCLYNWPLNVREVVQLAERTRALYPDAAQLRLEHLPEHIATCRRSMSSQPRYTLPVSLRAEGNEPAGDDSEATPRDELACKLLAALRETAGNVSLAQKLGISRPRAYRLMKRLPGVDPEKIRLGPLLESVN
jgi:transcriptional regulator with PAS, ATPase and Fis domain